MRFSRILTACAYFSGVARSAQDGGLVRPPQTQLIKLSKNETHRGITRRRAVHGSTAGEHDALVDTRNSIAELRHYRGVLGSIAK